MKKLGTSSNIPIMILGGLLLVYTAYRSYNFISMTLPADKQVLALFGLMALDGGLIFWFATYLFFQMGTAQRWIALCMMAVDFSGAVITFVADTFYTGGQLGLVQMMADATITSIVLALCGYIALNVAMAGVYHIVDPKARQKRAEHDLMAKIDDASLEYVEDNLMAMAQELAPDKGRAMMDAMRTNVRIDVKNRRASTRNLAQSGGVDDGNAAPRQLPARKAQLPAQEPEPMDYEEEETVQAEQVKLRKLPVNPTPRPNGRQG
jgi:hypothetical protein